MATGIVLKDLRIIGFRGYSAMQSSINLADKVIILMGGNRSGKSSTLNAIEWALFGDEVVTAGKVDIRERKNWLVVNRGCSEAKVDLVLTSGKGEIHVSRRVTQGKRKKSHEFV